MDRRAPHRAFALAACLALAAPAGRAAPAKGLIRSELVAELRRLVRVPPLRKARRGVAVADLVSGQMLFEYQADRLCSVASNNKLVTTAAALELLGPRFRFRTTVAAHGKLRSDGVLEGDLVVVGRGDPSISGRFHGGNPTAVLEKWAEAAAEAGIQSIRGGIVADETYFDRQHLHPEWPRDQRAAWYCAPIGALSFNDNCVLLTVRPGPKSGALAVASVDPPTAYVKLDNRCRTSKAQVGANRVLAHRRLGTNVVSIRGHIRHKGGPFRTWITIREPALFTATVFAEVLEAKGIPVAGPVRLGVLPARVEEEELRRLVVTESVLADAVAVASSRSHNLYAEQMLKTLGAERGREGSFAGGAEVVEAFLRDVVGVRGTFSYRDGSGLARSNRFSARQLLTLLRYMNTRRTGRIFLRSLAQPGEAGTLARRLLPLRGRVFAKTGYISGVSALSGYVESRGGRLLAFVTLVNDFRAPLGQVRAAQDAICLVLAAYEP
ncbi:MAG: D-alanyl-D-alanine carboxypeptidase/D-alanyl-D-alanine-endopeptidase [Candidatus Brocadiia bacterium]